MAKKVRPIEGQELAPAEPWRTEHATKGEWIPRQLAPTIAKIVLLAGFVLVLGGVLASQRGILSPLGGSNAIEAADQSPDASAESSGDPSSDPSSDASSHPAALIDPSVAPRETPAIDQGPTTDTGSGVLGSPSGGGGDEDHVGGDDNGADDHDGESGDSEDD